MSSYEPDDRAALEELCAFADHLSAARETLVDRWCEAVRATGPDSGRQPLAGRLAPVLGIVVGALDEDLRARNASGAGAESIARNPGWEELTAGSDLGVLVRELASLGVVLAREIAAYRATGDRLQGGAVDMANVAVARAVGAATAEAARRYGEARIVVEEKLVRANALLEEQDTHKSRFVSTVAHELRSPLNVIAGVAQILVRGRDSLGPHARLVEMLDRNVEGLVSLLNDLLDYSRLAAGKEPVNVEQFRPRHVIESIADAYRIEATAKGLELFVDSADAPDEVATDRVKLSRVLTNLLSNAIKFTERGSVTVLVGREGLDRWRLEVSDTGPGIPADELHVVFEEFVRVGRKGATHGAGLGLPIVARLVDALGGSVEATSAPGAGATFKVVLPITLAAGEGHSSAQTGEA